MQNTTSGLTPTHSGNPDEMHRVVVSDLASLIGHVRKSLTLIEGVIASEVTVEEMTTDNVVVLDDVTPGYTRVAVALQECDAGLTIALHLLRAPMMSADETGASSVRRPVSV